MSSHSFQFGMTDEQLATTQSVFANDLLRGKTALISGGGSGIGRAIAWLYSRLGAHVIICGRDEEKLQAAASAINDKGLSASYKVLNIRDPDAIERVMDEVFTHSHLDILVNNAGGQFPQPAIDFSPNGWKAVIDTNLNGTWFMMQAAAKRWRDSGKAGNIINIVAVIDKGMPDIAHTCAARAGVIYASKTVSVEWAPYNIRINCVAPGVIDSEGMKAYPDDAREQFYLSNPMKRPGTIWDIAQACGYLASEASTFTTGEVITIDGGGRYWGELWTFKKPSYFDH
ncbi:MAG: short-chain dehydrogenase [Cellvibrionaceae bacterium]|nr:short-chain dehydrogenase [Cellvibrionaceae bacterium]|tara:strand:- start:4650 stop:5504 length:855 start_codon:yes stop_codon:yes gene_type:complete